MWQNPSMLADNKDMKRLLPKKLRTVTIEPQVKKSPSKPRKTGLKKSDPQYFQKSGLISARKRAMSSEDFRKMALKSHQKKRKGAAKGGRPRKNDSE